MGLREGTDQGKGPLRGGPVVARKGNSEEIMVSGEKALTKGLSRVGDSRGKTEMIVWGSKR